MHPLKLTAVSHTNSSFTQNLLPIPSKESVQFYKISLIVGGGLLLWDGQTDRQTDTLI